MYPDVWYRLYDWPVHVCDKFLSDRNIWGDEPVLILCNGDKQEAIAEGFFSHKRHTVVRVKRQIHMGGGTQSQQLWHYKYKSDGKEMEVRYWIPIKNIGKIVVSFHNGDQIEFLEHSEMSWGPYMNTAGMLGMDSESKKIWQARNKGISINKRGIASLVDYACEPLRYSLRLVSSDGHVVWDKLAVRYYSKDEMPPPSF